MSKFDTRSCTCHVDDKLSEKCQKQYAVSQCRDLEIIKNLATYMWLAWYKENSPNWKVADDVMGGLMQISNMLDGLIKKYEI